VGLVLPTQLVVLVARPHLDGGQPRTLAVLAVLALARVSQVLEAAVLRVVRLE
jgi:hypothetical protein